MIVLSLFDGMSCGRIALQELSIPIEKYYASEVDKFAIQNTMANFPDTIQLGDVRNIDGRTLNVLTDAGGGTHPHTAINPYRVRTLTDCAGLVQMGCVENAAIQNAG